MTDFQHDCARDVPEHGKATAHELSHSSEPTGTEPTFQPVATVPAKTSEEALTALADEIVDLASRERDAFSALGDLDAGDARELSVMAEANALEATIMDRFMMLSLIRADTSLGLAAKGRALLAYREIIESCETPRLQAMLLSMARDAVCFPGATSGSRSAAWAMSSPHGDVHNPDSALLTIGRHFELQWLQERVVCERNGTDEEIRIEMDRSEDFVNRIRDLPATTPAGWHVKARAVAWTCSDDFSGECLVNVKVVASLLRDLGAIDGGVLGAPALPDPDRDLLAYQAPLYAAWRAERAAAATYDANNDSREAADAHDRAGEAVGSFARAVLHFPATSFDGLKLKAAALASLYPDEDITSECITGLKGKNSTDICLIVQIIRDIRAMVDGPCLPVLPQAVGGVETYEQAA